MKIALIGSRGIPARYGGFETFVQHLSEILSRAGHEVTVVGEKGNSATLKSPGSVRIQESQFRKSKNPLLFYYDSLRMTSALYDVVLVCGVGGALFYFMLKRKNTVLITNVDGLEHLRGKYSLLKKLVVRYAQKRTREHSDFVIADSEAVGKFWSEVLATPPRNLRVITYGADPALDLCQADLDAYGLKKGSYFLLIARLVPENHIQEIILGFLQSGSIKKLVIVGALAGSSYVKKLPRIPDSMIIFTGALYEKQTLDSMRRGAFAYIHGHSVGGTNPSLLEAMAASCLCICHDNIFNREVTCSEQLYFRSSEELSQRIAETEKMTETELDLLRLSGRKRAESEYTWKKIGDQYLHLLSELNERRNRV